MSIDIIALTASKKYTDKQIEKASIKGVDLSGYVQSVNGVGPDERGNVELSGGNADQSISVFAGRTASFYGDSLTEVNQHYSKGYHQWMKEILGLASYKNYGVSGYKVSDVFNKVNSVTDTSDIIFVMAGVNDVQFNIPLGTLAELEAGTVYGNLNSLCAKLREKYPTKLLTFITPAEQTAYPSTIGVSMHDIMKATKAVCEKHSIVVYDCFTYSEICTTNLSYWTTDNCHWNDKAHEMVGKNLAHFVLNTFRYIPGTSSGGGTSGGNTKTLNSITATFNQGDAVIYVNDTLDSLKQYLTVTANYSDGSTEIVSGYTLSGALSVGTSTITAYYGGKTASFHVEVTMVDIPAGFVGKTFRTKGYFGGKYNFTTLVGVDSDFVKGNTVEVNLSGSDAVNIVSASGYSGVWGDDTGACSNSAYNGQYAAGGNRDVTVDEEGIVTANISHSINKDVTTPYLKVNFILTPNSSAESISFTINQISVTVNGNDKEILDIGGFYSDEKFELVWNG